MTTTAPAGFAAPPTVNLCFVVIDQTTDRPDLAPFLPQLRDALDETLNGPFNAFHGGKYAFRVASSPTDRAIGEVAINVRHATAEDPQGALAWHQVTNGVPDIEINLDSTSGLTGDSQALDVCVSHEVEETATDAGANLLADNGNGKVSAREACDRVEDQFFSASNGLHMSNFLTPPAWIPGAAGPYDYMQVLTAQLDANGNVTMTPGGYDIEATAPSDYSDVTPQDRVVSGSTEHVTSAGARKIVRAVSRAPISGLTLQRKRSIYSRAYRHGVRL